MSSHPEQIKANTSQRRWKRKSWKIQQADDARKHKMYVFSQQMKEAVFFHLTKKQWMSWKKKHPHSQPQFQHLLLRGPMQEVNPVIFDKLDETTILQAASRTKGAAGPAKSFVSHHYGNTTVDLRKSVAIMAKLTVHWKKWRSWLHRVSGWTVSYTHLTLPTKA